MEKAIDLKEWTSLAQTSALNNIFFAFVLYSSGILFWLITKPKAQSARPKESSLSPLSLKVLL